MDELIETIYQAGCTPELWPRVMEQLAKSLNAATSALLYRATPEGISVESHFGFTTEQVESYATYFKNVDFHYNDFQNLPAGAVLADDHNFDFAAFTKTEIYQDFWRPAGLGRGMAGVLLNAQSESSIVSARRYQEDGAFNDSEILALQRLLRHLQRSLHVQNCLAKASIRADAMAVALDQFPIGVFMLERNCTVLDHNRAARELLADLHTPIQIREQRLTAHRPAERQALETAIRDAADSLHKLDALPCFLRFQTRDAQRQIVLMPIPVSRSSVAGPTDLVLLFCRETSTSYVDAAKLQRRFGFTAAEARLVAALAEGATVEEFAQKRRVSVSTARSQLKSAMGKADAHTQAQLVGTILRSLAALIKGC